jgi:hypothetical protein
MGSDGRREDGGGGNEQHFFHGRAFGQHGTRLTFNANENGLQLFRGQMA